MKTQKELNFDFYLPKMKVQTQNRAFDVLAEEVQSICGVQSSVLFDIFKVRLAQRSFGFGDGVAVFDVKSSAIKKPALVIATFDHDVEFESLDDKPVDIMAAVISPLSDGPTHLQKLAVVSRVLRCHDLRQALRDAKNEDEMQVLFMPSQDWMMAA
ncbi:MAG: PTS sugar transporter subunit IIA [Alphaproteobacteria bacterium]